MKNLLILPGGSPRQLAWAQKCEYFFRSTFDTVHFIQYENWQSGEENIDYEKEIEKIRSVVGDGEWCVFAKSIGSILTLKAVSAGIIRPAKCVFFGMPFSLIPESEVNDILNALSAFNVPSIAFHNQDDPKALYGATEEALSTHASTVQLITLQGDTHDYLDFENREDEIKNFLA